MLKSKKYFSGLAKKKALYFHRIMEATYVHNFSEIKVVEPTCLFSIATYHFYIVVSLPQTAAGMQTGFLILTW